MTLTTKTPRVTKRAQFVKSPVDEQRGWKSRYQTYHSFDIENSGKPAIISIGGWACTSKMYEKSARLFAEQGFSIHIIPLRGNATNRIFSSSPTTYVQDMAEDVLSYLKLKCINNVILLGHSCGYNVALRVNALIREREEKITVCGTIADAPASPSITSAFSKIPKLFSYTSILGKMLVKVIDQLCTNDNVTKAAEVTMKVAATIFNFASRIITVLAEKEARQANKEFWNTVMKTNMRELACSLVGIERNRQIAHEDLELLNVPTLVLGYQYDYLVDRRRFRYFSANAGTSTIRSEIVPRESHFTQQSNPEKFVNAVNDFIRRNIQLQ